MVASLLQEMRSRQWSVNGIRLKSVVDFLRLDEYGLLNSKQINEELEARVRGLRERMLPKRALVIPQQALIGHVSRQTFVELEGQQSKKLAMEVELAEKAACNNVFVDFPPRPHVEKIGEQSMVKLSEDTAVPLSKLYPTARWIKGYSQYRHRDYVFASPGYESTVANLALKLFAEKNIKLRKQLCLDLAKHSEAPDI